MPISSEQWPPEYEPSPQELRILHLTLLDQIRSDANAWFTAQYKMDTDRHVAADERGEQLARAVCWDLEEDFTDHPAAPTLRTALTRLVFAFTDPTDREDAVEDLPLMELIADLCNEQGSAATEVNIQQLANQLDMRSIHIHLCYQHLISSGVLHEGLSMSERFTIARDYTPLYFGLPVDGGSPTV